MRRPAMNVIIFRRITLLDDDSDLDKCLAWVKRRRLPTPSIVQEYSDRGRKLRRVVGTLKAGDLLLVPRVYNLATDTLLLDVLQRLLSVGIGVVFVLDGIMFKAGSRRSHIIVEFCAAMKEIDRLKRKENRKRGVLYAQFLGKQIGRTKMSEGARAEVEAHLHAGKNVAEIIKIMNGTVGRTSIFAIARAMKLKTG